MNKIRKTYESERVYFLDFDFQKKDDIVFNTYKLLKQHNDTMPSANELYSNPYTSLPYTLTDEHFDIMHKSFYLLKHKDEDLYVRSNKEVHDIITKLEKIYAKNDLVMLKMRDAYSFQRRYAKTTDRDDLDEMCLLSKKQEHIDKEEVCMLNRKTRFEYISIQDDDNFFVFKELDHFSITN